MKQFPWLVFLICCCVNMFWPTLSFAAHEDIMHVYKNLTDGSSTLDLTNHELNDEKLDALFDFLKKNPTITSLILSKALKITDVDGFFL
jgi:hypothetical protein